MRNPAGRNVFREFLRTEYSEENMLFWLACEDLKQEINKSAIEEKARSIYEDYISILSPKEVRELSAYLRLWLHFEGHSAGFKSFSPSTTNAITFKQKFCLSFILSVCYENHPP